MNWEMIRQEGNTEIYAKGERAVRVTHGYSTGSETGAHNFLGTYALAEAGALEDGDFIEDHYTKENSPNKVMVGQPKVYDGWDPEGDEVDWEAYAEWVDGFCKGVEEDA